MRRTGYVQPCSILSLLVCLGCGSSEPSTPPAANNSPVRSGQQSVASLPVDSQPAEPLDEPSSLPQVDLDLNASPVEPVDEQPPRTSFADLLEQGEDDQPAAMATPAAPGDVGRGYHLTIDDARAAAAGIRKLVGKHLTLYTDLPPSEAVDELSAVFDAAVPLWAEYFAVNFARVQDWQITGFLMQQQERFQGTGLLPPDLPPFQNGYQQGNYLWLYDQTEDYYRRHLLLHEGVHGFMALIVGGLGPPWYAEGMAELLGTHRWELGQLELGYMPKNKEETPGWGRIKIVRDGVAAGQGKWPNDIMDYGPTAHLRTEPYGWCWALAAFLDKHPKYQASFRRLKQMASQAGLTDWFKQQIGDDWTELYEDWQIYVMNLDYGYDVARAAVVRKPAAPLPAAGASATIVADRGWQSTGIVLTAGTTYSIEASGRFQIAKTSEVWWCEPGGVTIHYHDGRPVGLLLGAVRDDGAPLSGQTPLIQPGVIGTGRELTPPYRGTLYLKINESAAHLADNQGEITVHVNSAP